VTADPGKGPGAAYGTVKSEASRCWTRDPDPGEQILYNQAIIDGVLRSSKLKREVEITLP
jgi:hypothetical protein